MEYFNDTFFKKTFLQAVRWARDDPSNFFKTVFMYLTPFMILSAVLSYKLSLMIEETEVEQKKLQLMKSKKKTE